MFDGGLGTEEVDIREEEVTDENGKVMTHDDGSPMTVWVDSDGEIVNVFEVDGRFYYYDNDGQKRETVTTRNAGPNFWGS